MFDVIEIVLQFFDRILLVVAVSITDLSPTCNSRLDRVAQIVIGNVLFQAFDKKRPFRTGPDKAHFSFQYVVHLGDFIDPKFSNNSSYSGDSWIVFRCPNWPQLRLSIFRHGAKLDQSKVPFILPDSLLAIENRAWAFQSDRDCSNQSERGGKNQADERNDNIDDSLRSQHETIAPKSMRQCDPFGGQVYDRNFAR